MMRRLFASALLLAFALPAQTVLEQHGITWTIAGAASSGRFINGDHYVVAPLGCSLLAISPATAVVGGRSINGSMRNPGYTGSQGYGTGQYTSYDPARNVARSLPLALAPGDSIVSTISTAGGAPVISKAAILTVLAAAPAVPSFRPPYSGPNKPPALYPESMVSWGNIVRSFPASYAAHLNTPPPNETMSLTQRFAGCWLEGGNGWGGAGDLHPAAWMPSYYRDHGYITGRAMLALCADVPEAEKVELVIHMMQRAIDLYWAMRNGYTGGTDAHSSGRKVVVVWGGLMGFDPGLRFNEHIRQFSPLPPPENDNRGQFSEDSATFYVQETSPGVFNGGHGGYTIADKGLADWGNFHFTSPQHDNAQWWGGSPYRLCCTANGYLGSALAMHAMGGVPAWGHDAFFDYMDRYVAMLGANPMAENWWKDWGYPFMWSLYTAAKRADLPGARKIGMAKQGAPDFDIVTPVHHGQPFQIRVTSGTQAPRKAIIIRSSAGLLRPRQDFASIPLDGQLFVDPASLQFGVTIDVVGGESIYTTAATTDPVGTVYWLQAAVYSAAGGPITTTPAVRVAVVPQ